MCYRLYLEIFSIHVRIRRFRPFRSDNSRESCSSQYVFYVLMMNACDYDDNYCMQMNKDSEYDRYE